ncbi:MAG: AMP-binding protein, partial [Alphaproteobacteria bacterium]
MLTFLGALFLKGFKEVIGMAVGIVIVYLSLNAILLSVGIFQIATHPEVISNFYKIVSHYKATFFSAVPTVYSALLQVPVEDNDVTTLRFGLCGAAPMPVPVFEAFEKRTGIKILEGYGLTEGTCASSVNPRDGERKIGSIGIRVPFQQMKIVELDSQNQIQRECEPDEIGVIA